MRSGAVPFPGRMADYKLDMTYGGMGCREYSVTALVKKRILSTVDVAIMEALYRYPILNTNLIVLYINHISAVPEELKKTGYERNLRRLRKNGVLLLYRSTGRVKSNCYTLSQGAKVYMANAKKRKYYPPKLKPESELKGWNVARMLSLCQYQLCVKKWHGKDILQADFGHSVVVDGERWIIPSQIRYRVHTADSDNAVVSILAIPVRSGEEGLKKAYEDLNHAVAYLDESAADKIIVILCICESVTHMHRISAQLYRDSKIGIYAGSILYTTDSGMLDRCPMRHLYGCSVDERGVFTTTPLALSLDSVFVCEKSCGNC